MMGPTPRRPFAPILGPALGLLAALFVPLTLSPRAEAYIYWTSSSEDTIGRANPDGSAVVPRFIGSIKLSNASPSLAVDADHVYWASGTSGTSLRAIGRANLDGTGVNQRFITGLEGRVSSIAVDANLLYWTNGSRDAIGRANLDGTDIDESFIATPAGDVAAGADHLYWSSANTYPGTIGRANLDGTGVDESFIATTSPTPTGDVAVDGEHVYWTGRYFDAYRSGGTIGRANLDGTGIDPTFIPGGLSDFKPQLWDEVAVGATRIYWTTISSAPDGTITSLASVNLDGAPDGFRFPVELGASSAIAADALSDRKLAGRASAARTQRQEGKGIRVKVKVKAKERLTAKATGKVRVNPAYKLRPETVKLAPRETKALKLRAKRGAARKIAGALKRGEEANARLMVRLVDQAGNSETERLRVRLKP